MRPKGSSNKIVTWLIIFLGVVSILLSALPQSVQAAPLNVECKKKHTVNPGDTLQKIARDHNVKVARLANANNLTKPYNLVVGQSLCIPEEPKPSSNFKWSVVYSGDQVKVTGSDFKKQHPFIIKTRENDMAAWYKLGKTTTDKNGKMDAKFSLPKALLKKPSLNVCLKDGATDYLVCKQVFRQ